MGANAHRHFLVKPENCKHPKLHTDVAVMHFLELNPKREVAVLKIHCAECGAPYRFVGPSSIAGVSMSEPVTSPDGLELRAPIVPAL